MKLRIPVLMAVLAAVLVSSSLPLQAADAAVAGKWTAQVPGRDGQTRDVTFNFKTAGDKLTGTMSGRQGDVEISDGKVKGDELSFDVTMTMQGSAMKMTYKGKVAGDEIKFSRHRDGSDRTSEFTAHRAK
jgi:polyisoprenoid-binding protein YceI